MAIKEKGWKPLRKHQGKYFKGNKQVKTNFREGKGFVGINFELIIKDENHIKIDRLLWNSRRKFEEIKELLRLKYGME